jgi:hypothetical protein
VDGDILSAGFALSSLFCSQADGQALGEGRADLGGQGGPHLPGFRPATSHDTELASTFLPKPGPEFAQQLLELLGETTGICGVERLHPRTLSSENEADHPWVYVVERIVGEVAPALDTGTHEYQALWVGSEINSKVVGKYPGVHKTDRESSVRQALCRELSHREADTTHECKSARRSASATPWGATILSCVRLTVPDLARFSSHPSQAGRRDGSEEDACQAFGVGCCRVLQLERDEVVGIGNINTQLGPAAEQAHDGNTGRSRQPSVHHHSAGAGLAFGVEAVHSPAHPAHRGSSRLASARASVMRLRTRCKA